MRPPESLAGTLDDGHTLLKTRLQVLVVGIQRLLFALPFKWLDVMGAEVNMSLRQFLKIIGSNN